MAPSIGNIARIFALVSILLFISGRTSAQTDSTEKKILLDQMKQNPYFESDYQVTLKKWTDKMRNTHYPDLPLDEAGQVHYTFIKDFPGFSREYLYNRTLEWLAINYGIVPSDIYADSNNGKIIFRNTLDLDIQSACTYTSVISVKDGKFRSEFFNITYLKYITTEYSSTTEAHGINSLFPVILKKPSEWDPVLKMLKSINSLINREIQNQCDYISTYSNSEDF